MFLFIHAQFVPSQLGNQGQPLKLSIKRTSSWFEVRDARGTIHARLKNRVAYPGTYCTQLANGDVLLGYGAQQPAPNDEFLRVFIAANGSISIERDVYCTLPLFYSASPTCFLMSNIYADVVAGLATPPTLSPVHLAGFFIHKRLPQPATMWQEISILGERCSLHYSRDAAPPTSPPPRSWKYNDELSPTEPRDFPALIGHAFFRFAASRFRNQVVGFELSGGLDSSFLPLYLAKAGCHLPAVGASLLQPEHQAFAQQSFKIDQLQQNLRLPIARIRLQQPQHYPLAITHPHPLHLAHELYETAMAEMATYFQQNGVSVVATGLGGDQLVEHTPAHPSGNSLTIDPFITEAFRQVALSCSNPQPVSTLLSPSVVEENVAHANLYIERDIWPVSPFYDVALFNFMQALPLQFRANKNIYRAYFQSAHFPEVLYHGPNEDFSHFFATALLSARCQSLVAHFAANSALHRAGFIDSQKLQQTYLLLVAMGPQSTQLSLNTLYSVYLWLAAEINLHAYENPRGAYDRNIRAH